MIIPPKKSDCRSDQDPSAGNRAFCFAGMLFRITLYKYRKKKFKKSFHFQLKNDIINRFGMLDFQGLDGYQKWPENALIRQAFPKRTRERERGAVWQKKWN